MTYHGRHFDPLQLDPELMIAEMRALLDERSHTVFCSVDHEEQLRGAVAAAGLDHLVTVRATTQLAGPHDAFVFEDQFIPYAFDEPPGGWFQPFRNILPRRRPESSPWLRPGASGR